MNEAVLPAFASGIESMRAPLTSRGIHRGILTALLLLCLTAYLFATTELPVTSERLWYAVGIVIVCGIPMVTFAARPERWYTLLPLISLAYLVGFGVPAFTYEFPPPIHVDLMQEADYSYGCEMILLGCATMVLGMYMPVHRLISHQVWQWPSDDKLDPSRFAIAAVVGGIFRILIRADLIPEMLAQPVGMFASMSEIGTIVVFALWARRRASPVWCYVVVLGGLPPLLVGFGTSYLWTVLQPIFTLFVAYYGFAKRLPVKTFVVLALLFVPANLAKHEFRHQLERDQMTVFERPIVFAKIIWDGYTSRSMNLEDAGETVTGRMDHVSLMAEVVSMTPSRIPYWGGETYQTLLYAPIPRFVMPDKPRKGLGQDFGHRYHFIADEDYTTSINLAQLIEAYANFGPYGVGIGMFIAGLLYALVSALFERSNPPITLVAVGSLVALHLFNIESDFSLVNGVLLMSLPVLWILLHIMCWKVRTDPAGA